MEQQYSINDLLPVLEGLPEQLIGDDCHHISDNFETFAKYFKSFTATSSKADLDSCSDQVGLILAKSDGTESPVCEAAVLIVMESHVAMKAHSANDNAHSVACIKAAMLHASALAQIDTNQPK